MDSAIGRELGFTSDRFDGYLWIHPGEIYVSFIESRQQGEGHLSQLFDACWSRGLTIKVPTPFAHMEAILKRKGFEHTWEQTSMNDACEVWVKSPPTQDDERQGQWLGMGGVK